MSFFNKLKKHILTTAIAMEEVEYYTLIDVLPDLRPVIDKAYSKGYVSYMEAEELVCEVLFWETFSIRPRYMMMKDWLVMLNDRQVVAGFMYRNVKLVGL